MSLRERRKDDTADAFTFKRVEQAILDPAVEHTVPGLVDQAGRAKLAQNAGSLTGLFGLVVRDANVEGLALADGAGKRAHGLFQRRFRVRTVAIEDIHVFEAHALEGLVEAGEHILARTPFPVGAGPHIIAGLGGNDEFIPVGGEIFAQQPTEGLLGRAGRGAVVIGQVEVGDAVIEGGAGNGAAVLEQVQAAEVVPPAERDGGQFQPAAAAAVVLHSIVPVCRCSKHFGSHN